MGDAMNKLLLSALAFGALVMPAAAADMAPYFKGPVIAPAWSWTGFYGGGDVGGAFTTSTATWNPLPSPGVFGAFPATANVGGSGFAGGFFAGYNYQFASNFVAGIEGDWTGMRAGGAFNQSWAAVPGFFAAGATTSMSSEVEWAASLRGRLGYVIWPNLMAYGTGGAAWGKIQYGASSLFPLTGYAAGAAFTNTSSGWVAGGGLEWAPFTGFGLLLRAEYLYYDFSSAAAAVSTPPGGFLPSGYAWSATKMSVARFGMAYKF
jgi:outer membrane immunogenic protein